MIHFELQLFSSASYSSIHFSSASNATHICRFLCKKWMEFYSNTRWYIYRINRRCYQICSACELHFSSSSVSNITLMHRGIFEQVGDIYVYFHVFSDRYWIFHTENIAKCKICTKGKFIFPPLCITCDETLETTHLLTKYNCLFLLVCCYTL